MAHIPQKQWLELTEKEKEILKAIGITPEKHKAPPQKPHSVRAPDPYTLQITTHCQLCGGHPIQYFDMVLSDEEGVDPHLHAVIISEDVALQRKDLVKRETHSSICCECCTRLCKWTKNDLIINLVKARGKLGAGVGR